MKNYLSHHARYEQNLRDRFYQSGLAGFTDCEVLEILLTLVTAEKNVKKYAKILLKHFGSLQNIFNSSVQELQKVPRIGKILVLLISIVKETSSFYLRQCAENAPYLEAPDKLCEFWQARLRNEFYEVFEVAYLDSAYRLLKDGIERIAAGTVDRAVVYPRPVMEAALYRRAAALVFAHNHPNGDVTPSDYDKVLTRALVLAAETLQIKVVDHLIVSPDNVFSFRKEGLL